MLVSFKFFVWSHLLWSFLVESLHDASSDSFTDAEFLFVFGVEKILLDCSGWIRPKCILNPKALDFLQWARAESLNPNSRIDPQFIAWPDTDGAIKKFDSALGQYVTLTPLAMPDFNLTRFFSGASGTGKPLILEQALSKQLSLLGPDFTKSLHALHKWLFPNRSHKLIIHFTRNIKDYQYGVCYKQFNQLGLFPIVVKDFKQETVQNNNQNRKQEDHQINSGMHDFWTMIRFFESHEGQPITAVALLNELNPQSTCNYKLEEPERFYSVLVVDLSLLSSFLNDDACRHLSEFLQQQRLAALYRDAFDQVLFSCNLDRMSAEQCSRFQLTVNAIRDYWKGLIPYDGVAKTGNHRSHGPGVDDSILVGLATGLPQRTTLIVQVNGQRVNYPFPRERPSICYIHARSPGYEFVPGLKKACRFVASCMKGLWRRIFSHQTSTVSPATTPGIIEEESGQEKSGNSRKGFQRTQGVLQSPEPVSGTTFEGTKNPVINMAYSNLMVDVLETLKSVKSDASSIGAKPTLQRALLAITHLPTRRPGEALCFGMT